jgi:uncharacterized membrane protein
MNPLQTRGGTIILGIVLAILAIFALGATGEFNAYAFWTWVHVVVGIAWIGLLYYFNAVQVPGVAAALADKEPGPAAINKYIAPRALFWFRWAALLTWLTGAMTLEVMHQIPGSGFVAAFTFQEGFAVIGMGAWLGTIMLINVWGPIWQNQKKILGMKTATAEEVAKAKKIAFIASRTNVALSIPMLMGMVGHMHQLPF